MIRKFIVVLLALGIAPAGFVQTAGDFKTKYREVISYEVRPGIVMTPKYTADGQVCSMLLERRQETDTEIKLGYAISEKDVTELIDELVPKSVRGAGVYKGLAKEGPEMYIASGITRLVYTYENVSVEVLGLAKPKDGARLAITIYWPKTPCATTSQKVDH
jgi:hypothetical protein